MYLIFQIIEGTHFSIFAYLLPDLYRDYFSIKIFLKIKKMSLEKIYIFPISTDSPNRDIMKNAWKSINSIFEYSGFKMYIRCRESEGATKCFPMYDFSWKSNIIHRFYLSLQEDSFQKWHIHHQYALVLVLRYCT